MKKIILGLLFLMAISSSAFAREAYTLVRVDHINQDGSGSAIISFDLDGQRVEESVNIPTNTDVEYIKDGTYDSVTFKRTLIYLDEKAQAYIASRKEQVARKKYAEALASRFSPLFGMNINFSTQKELNAAIDSIIAQTSGN